ncbi:MAG: hypothetical protein NXI09_03270 [Bacteroidetes bacterium]|nr:hypothetical protein [Bacteroidota bacterium]
MMLIYRNTSGVLRALLTELFIISLGTLLCLLVLMQLEIHILWVILPASLLIMASVWKSVYQSSNASLIEMGGVVWYNNGLQRKCLGQRGSLHIKKSWLLPYSAYWLIGDEASILMIKSDYPVLNIEGEL